MPHPSTAALVAELQNPSVTSAATIRNALRDLGPAVNRASEQAAKIQALLTVAEIDETAPGIAEKFNGLRQGLQAVQRDHDKLQERFGEFMRSYTALVREGVSLIAEVDRVS